MWLKDGALHYYHGGRLLGKDVQISSRLMVKSINGRTLTRREDRMLKRTMTDMLRVVPFSAFILIPFMEFLLPLALRLFPQMLPSTFQDKLEKEENQKKRIKVKLKMAEVLQKSVQDMAAELEARKGHTSASAAELSRFMKKVRNGELVNNAYIIKFSKLFKDEITLDNLDRSQLVAICKYMNINAYGGDGLLKFQINHKLKEIRSDDKEIAWEGVGSMSDEELQTASMMRGMQPNLPREALEHQLNDWIELSRKDVPASLLILSRIFVITAHDTPTNSLATAMVSLPEEVVEETVMDKRISSSDKTLSNQERLEYILEQEERIKEEEEEIEESEREKEPEAKKTKKSDADNAVSSKETKKDAKESPKEALTLEYHAEEICRAILVLASKSATELEQEELDELKDAVDMNKYRITSLDDPLSSTKEPAEAVEEELNYDVAFLDKLLTNIHKDIKNTDEKIQSSMKAIDADDDGVITIVELRAAIQLLKDHPEQELVEKLFKLFDPDRDGKINLADVDRVLERLEEGEKTDEILASNAATDLQQPPSPPVPPSATTTATATKPQTVASPAPQSSRAPPSASPPPRSPPPP